MLTSLKTVLCGCFNFFNKGVVVLYFLLAVCSGHILIIPRWSEGHFSSGFVCGWWLLAVMTGLSLGRVTLADPGFITPDSVARYRRNFKMRDQPTSEFCEKCQSDRPQRAHHCTQCKRCVLRMDHHCPWVNNCIGYGNQWLFMILLFYTVLLTLWGSVLFIRELCLPVCPSHLCPPAVWYHEPGVRFWICVVNLIVAIVVGLLCGLLFLLQTLNMVWDRTTIEVLREIYQYQTSGVVPVRDCSMANAIIGCEHVCGYDSSLCYVNPCRRRTDVLVDDEILRLSALNV